WAAGDVDALAIPTSVRAVLSARIDLLSDQERAALDAASILGAPLDADGVRALVPELDTDAGPSLDALVRRELLAELPGATGSYRFRQAMARDVAVGLLTRESAATLHERAAEHIEATGGTARAFADHLGLALSLRVELGAGVDPTLVGRAVDALCSLGEEQL